MPLDPHSDAPGRSPLGITLPPIPEVDDGAGSMRPPVIPEAVVHPRGMSPWIMLLIGLIAGAIGGGGVAWWIAQQPTADASLTSERLSQMEGSLRGLEAELKVVRGQALEEERKLQETRSVVANITQAATDELATVKERANKAQQDLANLQLETSLTALNTEIQQSGAKIAITGGQVNQKEVRLTIEYWGFRITEREALQALLHFERQLRSAFPEHRFPEQFAVTFIGAQNGRTTRYRQGLWDSEEASQ
jgi:hypothetical protein